MVEVFSKDIYKIESGPKKIPVERDINDKIPPEHVVYEEPKEMDYTNVIYWSEHYKKLEGIKEGNAIRTKAVKFVRDKLIEYDKEKHQYVCKPIEGYNSTTYHFTQEDGQFQCSCQFWVTTGKDKGVICSHLLALYMQLKIWNYNRKKQKEAEEFEQAEIAEEIDDMYKKAGIENPHKR